MSEITPKQQRFVDEYLVDLNATQAAIRAGYSAKTAEQQGPRLLGNVGVAEAVAKAQQSRSKRTEITADKMLRMWHDIATVDINEIVEYRRLPCDSCYEGDPAVRGPKHPPDSDCLVCHGDGEGQVHIKDSRNLSPAARLVYAGVKQSRAGLEALLHSQDKAREMVTRCIGMLRDAAPEDDDAPTPVAVTVNVVDASVPRA